MKHLLCKILLVVFVFTSVSFGQSNQSNDSQIQRVQQGLLPAVLVKGDKAWSLDERMKHYKVPGLSIAIIKDFRVQWALGYGVKDVGTSDPVTTETLFQAGSISKSVNAMVAMKKVEQGKISLDENINNKLTSWKLPDNEFTATKKVTLRNLLSHTAGTTVHGFPGYAVTEKVPSLQQVLDGAAPANTAPVRVDIEPGTRFRYSGGGTTIAQLAIMDIEKKPYPEIARETVLAPLNMTNSTYSQPLPADWRKKAATGYRPDGAEVKGKIHVYPEMAAAGLWTTPTDLAKFAIEMQLSLGGRSNKVLTKESVATMTTSFMEDAGLGFFIEKHGNALYFGHGGADEGFRAELLVNRDKGYGVVVMANSDNGQILREVIRSVAREYGWDEFLPAPYEIISLDAAKLEGYTGRFQVNPDRVLILGNQIGKLVAQPTGDPPFELLPISETTFIRRDANLKYEFVRGAASKIGAAESIKIIAGGGTNEAKRISADTLVPYELLFAGKIAEAIEGYRNIRKDKPDNASVAEGRINTLGYTLLQQKKLAAAIALFKLNVEFYPNAWNTYDSLAEAYMTNGDKDLAIANYKKSLELNPGNVNGAEILKKLEAPGEKQPAQPKKAKVNGVELHYLERGAGTPVVFVHGGLEDYRSWQSQLEPFAEQYRVIAYSRRYNYPNNNPVMRPDHSAIVEAEDLAALIKSLKLGRAHVVGVSYGAYTALFLALKHPEMVRTLILAEAPVLRWAQNDPQGKALYEEFMTNLWHPTGNSFRRGDKEQALRLTVEYFLGKGTFDQIPAAVSQAWRDNLPEWQALTTSRDAMPLLRREDIKRIKAPTLMLSGERTLKIHKFVDGELQPLLQSVERVIIPEASHDMWAEHPDVCRQAALAFLARH